ncbi:MAG: hypothetical protein LBI86_12710 [Treponema sp.]|jgi:hypothetical protein|nr:hypothetical protein [Treponema sp.]
MRNKKILFLGLALVLLAMVAGVAFAVVEHEYYVTVYYYEKDNYNKAITSKLLSREFGPFWAVSAAEAQKQAQDLCTREYGEVASCGNPRVSGRDRER